jgi:enamine deaminase RidA (YjgF/YER057c/UK114 family)
MNENQGVRFLNPSTIAKPTGYTHVVEVTKGRIIFISGQIALDINGKMVGENDFRAQAVQVFENLKSALESVGADFSHVVKLNHYLLDAKNLLTLREVRDLYVNVEQPPASTLVEISQLFREGFLIETEAVAVIP